METREQGRMASNGVAGKEDGEVGSVSVGWLHDSRGLI